MSESLVKREMPSLTDLIEDKEMTLKKAGLSVLLNNPPPDDWLMTHPMASKVKYLPIERVEWLLSRIFYDWHVEIKSVAVVANSVVVCVRLHYFDPYITQGWKWQDGVGASPMQTDRGAGATDFNAIKDNAVMLAAPAAESYAIKDAAEKIGKIFGKDINRKTILGYEESFNKLRSATEIAKEKESERIVEFIANAKNKEQLEQVEPFLKEEHKPLYEQKKLEL